LQISKENMDKHKQSATCTRYAKYTTDELLSIFKEEAQFICKKSDEVHSIVESVLSDFIKRYGKYVRFVSKS
jgi:hypothetical protein